MLDKWQASLKYTDKKIKSINLKREVCAHVFLWYISDNTVQNS